MRFEKALALSLTALVAAACGQHRDAGGDSQAQSVAIAQTPVQDQQQVGFCWSYATMATMESAYKMRTGKDVSLSPEALGFYRMASGLYDLTRQKSATNILAQAGLDDLQGFDFTDNGYKDNGDAFQLLEQYGVVPQSVWSYHFNKPYQAEALALVIKANLVKVVWQQVLKGKDAKDLSMDDIISKVMVGKNAFPSRPPLSFAYEGRTVSSIGMMRDIMGFHPESYKVMTVNKESDLPRMLAAVKRTLLRGQDPLLGFPVVDAMRKGDAFTAKGVDLNDARAFKFAGGHAVVITDFVNQGSVEGAIKAKLLKEEAAKPFDALDYLVIKNSWGTAVTRDDKGNIIRGSLSGYYKIDRQYLVGATRHMPAGAFEVAVPADIAAAPFGEEAVNPRVSQAD